VSALNRNPSAKDSHAPPPIGKTLDPQHLRDAHPKPRTTNRWSGVVGGSDLTKAKEQLGDDYLDIVDWAFPENGLEAFKDGKLIEVQSLKKHLGEVKKPQTIDAYYRPWTIDHRP
jgi:hypothetical protein